MSDIKNQIRLMPVKDLLGMNFFIPGYQRGYRWKTRQVEDLLDDIYEFMNSKVPGKYCLQPLVVKRSPIEEYSWIEKRDDLLRSHSSEEFLQKTIEFQRSLQRWDVVDGQQRLTTTFILLSYLMGNTEKKDLYTIEYETRKGSSDYLKKLTSNEAEENIDYWHMYNTNQVIDKWFKDKEQIKEKFKACLLENTEFIWYETEEDPIEVFTRLNIGKISLTNAELVKALFLNDSNNENNLGDLRKNEIAILWDRIECTLQRNEFWNFIHDNNYNQPTRIDFILELVMKLKNNSKLWKIDSKLIGTDSYKTFRYFYQLFEKIKNNNEKIKNGHSNNINYDNIWKEIKTNFDIFIEWYNDLDCYHYIGYLVACANRNKENFKLEDYVNKWNGIQNKPKKNSQNTQTGKRKEDFVEHLKETIKPLIKLELKNGDNNKSSEWYKYEYDKEKGYPKTKCFPLLLLFNIQTIINRNRHFKDNPKFNASEFQRFPFHLFKNEKGWDIEHIAPNTDNNLEEKEEQEKWLESALFSERNKIIDTLKVVKGDIPTDNDNNLIEFIIEKQEFKHIYESLEKGSLDNQNRNKIWNFCLLDQSTNRSYGNSIFASKRKEILERDRENKGQVFILECTKNVFTKYYSTDVTDLRAWTKEDAEQYLKCIYETLQDFGLKKP